MRRLLVLSVEPGFAGAVEAALDPALHAVLSGGWPESGLALLERGAVDAVLLDGAEGEAKTLRAVRELRAVAPEVPVYVYAEERAAEWEEALYHLGVERVLPKPVRGGLLARLLDLRCGAAAARGGAGGALAEGGPGETPRAPGPSRLGPFAEVAALLREASDPARLVEGVLAKLRAILGVNRTLVFLRSPAGPRVRDELFSAGERRMAAVCALGVEREIAAKCPLDLDAGIGGVLRRSGAILRAADCGAERQDAAREFALFGATVAVPVVDREGLLGVALFGDRVTGGALGEEDLGMLYGVLEEVGRALRNAWAAERAEVSRGVLEGMLEHLASGCVLVGEDLSVLHANRAARGLFGCREGAALQYADLPQAVGSAVFSALKRGESAGPIRHEPRGGGRVFAVAVSPAERVEGAAGRAALVVAEEISERERLVRLEREAAGLRLLQAMAAHLSHEIGNAIAPVSAHAQLLEEQYGDPEFRESLGEALGEGVRRISRLAAQMLYLAEAPADKGGTADFGELIAGAFHDAVVYRGASDAEAVVHRATDPCVVRGDARALKHALLEVFLNALQANPGKTKVAVNVEPAHLAGGKSWRVEIRDAGQGFTPEASERATEPFFTTRNVGLGLGLTVTRKIVEGHGGTFSILPGKEGEPGTVEICLPSAEAADSVAGDTGGQGEGERPEQGRP